MILVAGSTGTVGHLVVQRLRQRGQPVRALVRPGAPDEKLRRLRTVGAEIVEADLKDPPSLMPACAGIDTVVSTASAMISRGEGDSVFTVDRDGQVALVDAARQAGVRHFIYLSFSGHIDGEFPLREAKRTVERRLIESGLAYTILRPSFFMEVWLGPHLGFDPIGGTVRIFGSGDRPVSMISALDVAEYAAACVGNAAVLNQVIELGGPRPVTVNEVVALYETALGRSVQRQHVPETALTAQLAGAQDPVDRSRAGLALTVARGDAIDVAPALQKVPIRLTPVEDFVARTLEKAQAR